MIIRKSTTQDKQAIYELLVEAFTAGYKKKFPNIVIDAVRMDGFRKAVSPNEDSCWLVAEDKEKIVGSIRLIKPPTAEVWLPDAVEMKGLTIAEHLQGKKVAHELVERFLNEVNIIGAKYICGRVRKEATELRKYYESMGCIHDPRGDQTHPNVNLVGYIYKVVR